jgi:hypothetical protein
MREYKTTPDQKALASKLFELDQDNLFYIVSQPHEQKKNHTIKELKKHIKGGLKTVQNCSYLIMEVPTLQYNEGSPLFDEIIEYMNNIPYSDLPEKYDPTINRLYNIKKKYIMNLIIIIFIIVILIIYFKIRKF